jgi:hypothetical protein
VRDAFIDHITIEVADLDRSRDGNNVEAVCHGPQLAGP